MNKLVVVLLLLTGVVGCAYSQAAEAESQEPTEEKNNWGAKLIKSPFGLGLDIQTKYVWRGMEMMPENSAPVLFPSANFSWKGLYVLSLIHI